MYDYFIYILICIVAMEKISIIFEVDQTLRIVCSKHFPCNSVKGLFPKEFIYTCVHRKKQMAKRGLRRVLMKNEVIFLENLKHL